MLGTLFLLATPALACEQLIGADFDDVRPQPGGSSGPSCESAQPPAAPSIKNAGR